MYVFTNAELPSASIPGIQHRTLAGREAGLTRLSVWHQSVDAGGATPPHRHDCEEVVVVQSSSGELLIDGTAHRFGPDSTLVIPPNVDHQIVNTGGTALRMLAVFSMSPVAVFLPDGQPLPLPWNS